MAKKDEPQQGVAEQLQPLVDDDAFLTTLSEGTDPSDGGDELAGLLLELRGDVEKQMPPAPLIEGAEEEPEIISLGAARRRRSKPFMHGLIGAAAATLLIAGTGAVVVNAGPGSPLYGVNQSLFGADEHDVSVVELAGTLDEMEKRSAQGDMDGTRQLLEEARKMVDQAKREREAEAPRTTKHLPSATVTQTHTVEKPAPVEEQQPPEPETVTQTETAVSTVVVTRTVSAGNPLSPPEQNQPEPGQQGGDQATPPQGDNSDGASDGATDNGQLPPAQFQQ